MRRITIRSHLSPNINFIRTFVNSTTALAERQDREEEEVEEEEEGGSATQRTGRPQPTQSSITVPSLFTLPPPFGVGVPAAAGVPASRGGVPGLELGSVLLCDAARAPA